MEERNHRLHTPIKNQDRERAHGTTVLHQRYCKELLHSKEEYHQGQPRYTHRNARPNSKALHTFDTWKHVLEQWDKLTQIQNGRTQRIGNVAIEIDRLCECMDISQGSKLQKFFDAMHPELRLQVEPKVDKQKFNWEEVVSDAERCDDALFQAGKYAKGGKDNESFAVQHQPSQHKTHCPFLL